MMRLVFSSFLALCLFFAQCSAFAADNDDSFWADHSRGWHWYEDPAQLEQPNEEKPKKEEAPVKPVEKPKRIQDMTNAAEIRAELSRLLDIASANPTKENVKTYMEANKYVLDTAGKFTEVWSSILRETPTLDNTVKSPVNALAMRTQEKQTQINQAKQVAKLSRTHGLFFFFRGDCPYCHAFAPTLALFAKQFGMEIFPVSLDGGALPEYPHPTIDSGMADNLGITTVPAVFIGDKVAGQVMPIGYGVMALSDLLQRIYTVTTTEAPK